MLRCLLLLPGRLIRFLQQKFYGVAYCLAEASLCSTMPYLCLPPVEFL